VRRTVKAENMPAFVRLKKDQKDPPEKGIMGEGEGARNPNTSQRGAPSEGRGLDRKKNFHGKKKKRGDSSPEGRSKKDHGKEKTATSMKSSTGGKGLLGKRESGNRGREEKIFKRKQRGSTKKKTAGRLPARTRDCDTGGASRQRT